jgi:hypothetical protein
VGEYRLYPHTVEQMVTPHVMMPDGRQGVNYANQHERVRREFMPLIDAMPGCGVAAAELRHRPDAKYVDAAIV